MLPYLGRALAALTLTSVSAIAQSATPTTTLTADLGYVSATGNTRLTTLSAGEKVVHTTGKWKFTQLSAFVFSKTDSTETANQLRLVERFDFALPHRFGVFANVAYERNRYAGFNSRVDEAAGLLWKAIVAPFDSMSVDAGGVLTQESDVDGTSLHHPSARLAANYKHLFSKTSNFQEAAEYVPDLKTSGAYRLNSESALIAPLSAHAAIKMAYSVRYDSRPPVDFRSTDRVFTTGIQLTF